MAKHRPPPDDRDHLGMMKNPSRWPVEFLLPLRKHGAHHHDESSYEILLRPGVVVNDKTATTVYLVNMFMIPKTREEFAKIPTIEYDSFEAIVADGWFVD